MSNIHTSYIRVYRRDGKDLTKEEMDTIFQLAVKSYKKFGSYWVRILRKYRELEKCFDIQYGSGKRYHLGNLLEDKAIFDKYFVWERFADEGGFHDSIFTLEYNGQWVDRTDGVPCTYAFDEVRVFSEEKIPYFDQFRKDQGISTEFSIKMTGTYFACNSRGGMDMYEGTEFNGPCLQYDPHYASDYFVPTDDGCITESPIKLLNDIFEYPHKELPEKAKIALYWKNRMVQSVERKWDGIECLSADYWDNCVDKNYLDFKYNVLANLSARKQ